MTAAGETFARSLTSRPSNATSSALSSGIPLYTANVDDFTWLE